MKELSIEEKAKRYDNAIEIINDYYLKIRYSSLSCASNDIEVLEKAFPELRESGDEGIIKSINRLIRYYHDVNFPTPEGFTKEQLLSWIEKQGEPKSTDKVESKFKVGDWVVYDHRAYQVVELPKEGYINLGLRRNGKIEFAPSTYCRFWTIQDAKAGDVLETEGFVFIFKEIREDKGIGYFCANEKELHKGDDDTFHIANPNSLMGSINNGFTHYTPATKEQRDTLMKAMANAGYTFDFEKKELKKIEQKPAWSEEDQKIWEEISDTLWEGYKQSCNNKFSWDSIRNWLKPKIDFFKDKVQPKQEWSEEDEDILNTIINHFKVDIECTDEDDIVRWLKFLKERYTWKPSEEQLNALHWCVMSIGSTEHQVLQELLEQLEKLKD